MARLGNSPSPRLRFALASSQGGLPAVERCHGGVQIGDLVIDVLDGVFELVAIGPGLGHLAADLGLGGRQVRFRRFHGGLLDGDLNLVRLRVELDQHVPLLHAVIVIHQHLAHLALHAGSHESDVAVDIGVIGGNRVQRRHHPGRKEISAHRQGRQRRRQQQQLPRPARSPGFRRRRITGRGTGGRRGAFLRAGRRAGRRGSQPILGLRLDVIGGDTLFRVTRRFVGTPLIAPFIAASPSPSFLRPIVRGCSTREQMSKMSN